MAECVSWISLTEMLGGDRATHVTWVKILTDKVFHMRRRCQYVPLRAPRPGDLLSNTFVPFSSSFPLIAVHQHARTGTHLSGQVPLAAEVKRIRSPYNSVG